MTPNTLPDKNPAPCPSRLWIISAIILGCLLAVMLVVVLAPTLFPLVHPPQPEARVYSLSVDADIHDPAEKIDSRVSSLNYLHNTIYNEIERAEIRLRDHFILLLTFSGIAVTIILGGFSFSISRREERYIRDMRDCMHEGYLSLDRLEKASQLADTLRKQMEERVAQIEFIRNSTRLIQENKTAPIQVDVSEKQLNLAEKVSDSLEAQAAYFAAGLEYYELGDHRRARVFFGTYLKNNSNDPQTLFKYAHSTHYLALSLSKKERRIKLLIEAQQLYKRVTNLLPTEYISWNNIGMISESLADETNIDHEKLAFWNEAEEAYQRVLYLNPEDGDVSNDLCMIFLKHSQFALDPQKKDEYRRMATKEYENAQRWRIKNKFNAACCSAILGDEQECKNNLQEARRLGQLPSRSIIENEKDLFSMHSHSWFQEILNAAPEKDIPDKGRKDLKRVRE